jgi:hypothetical protein
MNSNDRAFENMLWRQTKQMRSLSSWRDGNGMISVFWFTKKYFTDADQLFSISTEDWTRENGSKLQLVGFGLNIKNSFLAQGPKILSKFLRGTMESPSLIIFSEHKVFCYLQEWMHHRDAEQQRGRIGYNSKSCLYRSIQSDVIVLPTLICMVEFDGFCFVLFCFWEVMF